RRIAFSALRAMNRVGGIQQAVSRAGVEALAWWESEVPPPPAGEARIDDPTVISFLGRFAKSDASPSWRAAAAQLLGLLKNELAIAPLKALSSDPDAGVRRAAAESLGIL